MVWLISSVPLGPLGAAAADAVGAPVWVVALTGVLAVVAGAAGNWVASWFQRRKVSADTAEVVRETYSGIVADLRKELDARDQRCKQRIDELSWALRSAQEEIVRLGGDPTRLRRPE